MRPDYEKRGITTLSQDMKTIVEGEEPGPLLRGIDLEGVEKLLMMTIDGLGLPQLEYAFEMGAAPNLERASNDGGLSGLTTTLPSTTVSALVSLSTGYPPEDHGFLGFRLLLEEAGVVADMLRLTVLGSQTSLTSLGVELEALIGVDTLLTIAGRSGFQPWALTRREFIAEPFTGVLYGGGNVLGYRNCQDLMRTTADACRQDGKALVFAYWDTIDITCHRHGGRSEEFLTAMAWLDSHLGEELLGSDLRNVLFILTADHGHLDCPPEGNMNLLEHDRLMSALSLTPTGEPRMPYLHLKDGKRRFVFDYLDDHFSDVARWLPSEEALRMGLFGPSGNLRWSGRLGDVVLLPSEGYYFTCPYLLGEETFVGRHGGTTPEEMLVPFLWTRL